ncbi:MAG TPA: hypothetical protein VFT72_00485 [Opitutaceae bacterium]|nr:hypothetical protein [Opitutaceae bacterium]
MKTHRWHLLFGLISSAAPAGLKACEICRVQQPKFLGGLTHGGAGPEGNFDYVIVAVTLAITVFTFVWAIKCLVRPGEHDPDHIKRTILN